MYPPPFQYNDIRFTGYTIDRGYLGDGGPIDIRKKPDLLKLLHPAEYNFYERCRTKLGWGGHLLND